MIILKRIVSTVVLFAVSLSTLAATTVPVQLLNPAGSASGQVIVSTGASSAPAWGAVGVSGIAAIASNTVLANATASLASPTAVAIPSCTTSASALEWTSASGFGCNTAINAATLGGATFSSPGAIGATTASTGKFTTLQATAAITPTYPAGITGNVTGSSAAAGSIGELVSASTGGTAITSGTTVNATSLALTAGDWDCWGQALFVPSTSSVVADIAAGITTTSAVLPAAPDTIYLGVTLATGASGVTSLNLMTRQINVSSPTTIYVAAEASSVTVASASVSGYLRCRRR